MKMGEGEEMEMVYEEDVGLKLSDSAASLTA